VEAGLFTWLTVDAINRRTIAFIRMKKLAS